MGRKRMTSGEEFEAKIDAYFDKCDALNGADAKKLKKPYSLSGLLCELALTRSEFERLCANRRYARAFTRALARIEAFIEENALMGTIPASAAANSLKVNFGWGAGSQAGESAEGTRNIRIVLDEDMMRLAE